MNLSIVIAAYNVGFFIEKCIKSCIQQNIKTYDYEVIVVNDGSNDDTFNILNKLKSEFKNLVVVNTKNKGLGAARNIGLTHAKGKYVWFIDGDDYLSENILKEIVNNLNKIDCLVINYNIIDADLNVVNKSVFKPILDNNDFSGKMFYRNNLTKSYTWLFIFKKSILINNSIRFLDRISMQDAEVLPRIMFYIHNIKFLNLNSYNYVQHLNSSTNSESQSRRYNYFKSITIVKSSLEKFRAQLKNDCCLEEALNLKIISLNYIVFQHLIHFKYQRDCIYKIINLLKMNSMYPIHVTTNNIKYKIILLFLNCFPYFTNYFISKLKKIKSII